MPIPLSAPGMERSAMPRLIKYEMKMKYEMTREMEVLLRALMTGTVSRTARVHREVESEGSCKQTSGPTNRNRIRGS